MNEDNKEAIEIKILRTDAEWEGRECQLCGCGPLMNYYKAGRVTVEQRAAVLCVGCAGVVCGV